MADILSMNKIMSPEMLCRAQAREIAELRKAVLAGVEAVKQLRDKHHHVVSTVAALVVQLGGNAIVSDAELDVTYSFAHRRVGAATEFQASVSETVDSAPAEAETEQREHEAGVTGSRECGDDGSGGEQQRHRIKPQILE
jgi:hypothetical protein